LSTASLLIIKNSIGEWIMIFSCPKRGFSDPTHFEGKSEPGMHEGSVPGIPPFFVIVRVCKTMGDQALTIKNWDQV
jgi:hypothetical protein